MKVINKTTTDDETSVEIDLFDGKKLKKRVKDRISDEVGNFLVEQTLVSMGEKRSPVEGEGAFKPLSPLYKKKKKEEVGSTEANLEFDGIMKDELEFRPTKNGVEIGVYGERARAADGHNNLSGNSNLPKRRFLPDEGQKYKSGIRTEMNRIVADIIAEETTFRKAQFRGITTSRELYAELKKIFGQMSRSELQIAVYRNDELTDMLHDMNLLRLLD